MAGREFPKSYNALPTIPEKHTIEYNEYETHNPEPRYNSRSTKRIRIHNTSPGNAELTERTAPLTERNLAIQRAVHRAEHWRKTQLAQQQSGQAGAQPAEPLRHDDYVVYVNNRDGLSTERDSNSCDCTPTTYTELTSYMDTTDFASTGSNGYTTLSDSDGTTTLLGSGPVSFDSYNTTIGSSINSSDTCIESLVYDRALLDFLKAEQASGLSRACGIAPRDMGRGGKYMDDSGRPHFNDIAWGERTGNSRVWEDRSISPHTLT